MSDTGDTTPDVSTDTAAASAASIDSGYTQSYEVTTVTEPYAPVPEFDPGVPVVETGSTSYDSTDYSVAAEASEAHMADYNAMADVSNDLYQASVDAYLAGDEMAAYELNQASIAADGVADESWSDAQQAWSPTETTTVTSYEAVPDTSYADTSYVDTSAAAPVADTTSYTDTSYTDTTATDTTSEY